MKITYYLNEKLLKLSFKEKSKKKEKKRKEQLFLMSVPALSHPSHLWDWWPWIFRLLLSKCYSAISLYHLEAQR